MTNSSNEMTITNNSLSQVSKELIDKRVYKEGTITKIGNPIIVNGVASNLSSTNYFTSTSFSFSEISRNVKITFSGIYSPYTNTSACAWELKSQLGNLSLTVVNNSVTLKRNNGDLISFPNLTFNTENSLNISIIFSNTYTENVITQQSCFFSLILNNQIYTKTINVTNPITFKDYTSLYLGNNSTTENAWQGDIYIADFALYQNDTLIYTPSARNSFKFTKIGIGDGSIPLLDNSIEVLNHLYFADVKVVSQTNNNVLLASTIPANYYLNITEIALYYEDDIGSHIFSKISNLAITKGRNLSYNLIMHVNLDINIVNTVAVPEIIIEDEEYIKYTDFLTVKQVYAYITENMERLIRLNALGIGSYSNNSMTMDKAVGVGFNKPQVLYRAQNEVALCVDNYNATQTYSKLKNKFTPKRTITFDPSKLNIVGNSKLNTEGIGSSFSKNDYITSGAAFSTSQSTNWKAQIRFKTGDNISTTQGILDLGQNYGYQPLSLYSKYSYCYLLLNGTPNVILSETIGGVTTSYSYFLSNTIELNNTIYYVWVTSDPASYSTVLTSTYTLTSITNIYDEDGNVISGLHLSSYVNTKIYDSSIFRLTPNTEYQITVEYSPDLYKVTWKNIKAQEEGSSEIISSLKMGEFENTYFGVSFDTLSEEFVPFFGTIDFTKTSFYSETYSNNASLLSSSTQNYMSKSTTTLSLQDYFYIPDYAHHYYNVANLNGINDSYLEVFEETFKGTSDKVDFLKSSNGFTLCAKVHLFDNSPKVLLGKGNIADDIYYFILEEEINALVFKLNLQGSSIIMRKDFTNEDIRSYIDNPITITITCDGKEVSPTFKMYKNNDLISTYVLSSSSSANINGMYLLNYRSNLIEDFEKRTVHTILDIDGEVSTEDLYYINNILGTNF